MKWKTKDKIYMLKGGNNGKKDAWKINIGAALEGKIFRKSVTMLFVTKIKTLWTLTD
jgi:hypothetical protein